MELTSTNTIKGLLKNEGIRPFKGFGQNFLINKGVLKKIITAADLKPNDTVLEIGSGLGTLTKELAKNAKEVIAVEKDPKMAGILKKTLRESGNIRIVREDALKFDLGAKDYKVVANLPYNIASPVIRKFLEAETPPKEMVLMVQKEVAQRICAKPPRMNLLAVSVQFYAKPKIVSYVSKKSFWPAPKVDSAIIKITPGCDKKQDFSNLFFKIVKSGFSQPRKQLLNNLSKSLKFDKEKTKTWLLENKIPPARRAETLKIGEWIRLAKSMP